MLNYPLKVTKSDFLNLIDRERERERERGVRLSCCVHITYIKVIVPFVKNFEGVRLG